MLALLSTGAGSLTPLAAQPATAPVTPAQAASPRGPQPPRGPQSQVARVTDLMQMMAALPDTAPATPKQPRRVLVLAKAGGVHPRLDSARGPDHRGDGPEDRRVDDRDLLRSGRRHRREPAAVRRHFPRQHDRHLSWTIRPSGDRRPARRKAFMDFIRGGKGLGGDPRRHRLVSRPLRLRRRRRGSRAGHAAIRSTAAPRCGPSTTR